jgi:2-keto-3-deoxy-L-arabinonate dehydratase
VQSIKSLYRNDDGRYHGALLKGTEEQTFEQVARVGEVGLPIMLQDAPLSGIELTIPLLTKMAREIEMLKLLKIESVGTAAKLDAQMVAAGDHMDGPFDGEERITLLADLEAGATGTMVSATMPNQIKPVVTSSLAGDKAAATAAYARVLPAINHENRQCGFRAAKEAIVKDHVIKSAFCRHPIPRLGGPVRAQLMALLRPLDPVILSWDK